MASRLGVWSSKLLPLLYFDPVRMLVIDPMHCLYLGIAKHVVKIWLDWGFLSTHYIKIMQECMDACVAPPHLGWDVYQTKSLLPFLDWLLMNWNTGQIYSPSICLIGLIPHIHMGCWRLFVMDSRLLSKHAITDMDIAAGNNALLLKFCRVFETEYGKSCVTPNMHMACHIYKSVSRTLDLYMVSGYSLSSEWTVFFKSNPTTTGQ